MRKDTMDSTGRPVPARRRAALLFLRATAFACLGVALATGACSEGKLDDHELVAPAPTGGHFYVAAPERVHYGGTYAEWSQRWWQWAFELPRTNHPLYDRTGEDAWRGQIAPVWFLGGVFSGNGEPVDPVAVRDVIVPRGVALFFPIINFGWDNTNCLQPDTDYSYSEMRRWVADSVEGVTDVLCEIDGARVIDSPDARGAERFRAQAPAFSLWLTDDNIYSDYCGGVPLPARMVDPFAADGIWMMVSPLPPGGHTIHFSATAASGFRVDVTYNLTVTR